MISIDDHPPPDPSSSHHHHRKQQISHDLNVSDIDLKSPDADLHHTNNQLPNFSIRDYVFGLRSKDVACNWPFSSTSLQLCLKNGVKNLLPPFQPLDLLRDNSSINRSNLGNRLPDEEIINNFDGKSTDNQFKSNEKRALKSVIKNSSGSKQDNRLTHVKSKEKPPASSSQNTINIKKSRLVMKLNLGVEPVDEIDPSSFIVSETMASKICPVCKTFSSSSNTTLNAHIDQCLTGEGTMKWTDNPKVVIKHRIKSRKTRLMVDVYKTAPHCTVEELDRRNGTSWATNSSFPAQEFQFQGEEEEEEEKQEPKITTVNRRVADNEGDVYIETDGTKVRILSVPKPGSSSDNNGIRKLLKGLKGSKFLISKKKNNLYKQKHHQKYLKVSPHARKLRSLKPQAKSLQEEDVPTAENCSRDERPEEPVKARVETKMADLAIVRPPWACSKRTHRVKKFIGKPKHQKLELQCRIESDKSSSPPHSSDKVDSSQSRKKLRTSSPLIRQPLTFRNENTRMDEDSCEDSPDSSDSKFPSLKKNLNSFPAAKFNLKRKSYTIEKSFDGAFQDSLKEHATVRKNKETRSVDSKSSNEESSSIRVETADGDASHDIESVRNETISNLDQVSTVPPSNFMGLSNSFDPEFSKQECVDLYQDQQLLCSTNRAPDVEKHDFFFQEDDPIPIPGPPGSFLPSPGGGEDTVSEEQLQAISSLTTTVRVLTTENEHHHDQDSMSNSPVSTVSNPSLARSDSRSTSLQDDHIRQGISSFMVPKSGEYSDPSPASFKNDQPCCCSRKDSAFSYTLPPYYQESSMIRKQPIESKRMINGFNFRSEPPETAIFPTVNKLPVYNDCDSAASPSKPVLRLMGKNLTVVKTDEDSFRPPQASQQPVIFSQYQNGSDSQHFNGYPPVNMRRNTDSRVSHGSFMTPVNRYYGYGGEHTAPQRSHHGNNTSSTSKIIIIDDSPENIPDDSMRNEILRRNRVGQVNPLYTMYQAQSSGHLYGGGGGGSTVFRGGGFQTSLTNGDLNLNKWNVAGSSSSSPSRSTHFRSSSVYYPPSYP